LSRLCAIVFCIDRHLQRSTPSPNRHFSNDKSGMWLLPASQRQQVTFAVVRATAESAL
jgi:hypothetical protein